MAIIFLPKSVQNLDTTQHAEFLDHGNFNYSTVILFLERVQGKERWLSFFAVWIFALGRIVLFTFQNFDVPILRLCSILIGQKIICKTYFSLLLLLKWSKEKKWWLFRLKYYFQVLLGCLGRKYWYENCLRFCKRFFAFRGKYFSGWNSQLFSAFESLSIAETKSEFFNEQSRKSRQFIFFVKLDIILSCFWLDLKFQSMIWNSS